MLVDHSTDWPAIRLGKFNNDKSPKRLDRPVNVFVADKQLTSTANSRKASKRGFLTILSMFVKYFGCLDLVNCSHPVKNVATEKYDETMKDLEDPPSLECSAEVLGLEEKCLSSTRLQDLQASLQFP